MRRKVLGRIVGIGIFHTVLYLYIVPFVIYPRFGRVGFQFILVVAVIVSIAVFGTMFIEKNRRK